MTVSLLLLFALAGADPQAAPGVTAAAKTENSADKVICKKFLETGSLVKGVRVCKTKAEWEHDRANIQAGFNSAASCRTNNGQSCF